MPKQKFLLIIFLITLFGAAFLGNYFILSKNINKEIEYWKSLAEQCFPPLPQFVVEATGDIIEIGDGWFSMKYKEKISRFPLPQGGDIIEKVLKVKVPSSAEIQKLEIVQDEQGNYIATTTPSSFEEIKTGTKVSIIPNENIKEATEVTAQTITILK